MASVPMAGAVLVSIVSANVRESPPAWLLDYEVRNESRAAVWLVVDESLGFRREGSRIELSYARGPMQAGAQPFGYFDPEVAELPAGGSVRRHLEIPWPSPLSTLWNEQRAAAPPPGEYEVSVRIGYAGTPSPEPPRDGESVEAPVLRWQRTAESPPVRIAVPAYAPSGERGPE